MSLILLSPCDSCLTLSYETPQYNDKLVTNYLNKRLSQSSRTTTSTSRSGTLISSISLTRQESCESELELIMIYNHHDINIKLTSIHNLIDTHKSIDMLDLTVNDLLLFVYYNQQTMSFPQFYINQLELIHLGKAYTFAMNYNSPKLTDLNINNFNKFLLVIKPDNDGGIYRFFEMESFIKQSERFVDKSTGDVTYVDALVKKIKGNRQLDKLKVHKRRKILLKFLRRLYT